MKTVTENKGAAAALKWLSDEVSAGEKRLAKLKSDLNTAIDAENNPPPSRDGEDFKAIRARCRQNHDDEFDSHLKLLTKLQLFDKTVSPEKRDASESITRTEGENLLSVICISLRASGESIITRSVPAIREAKTNEDAYMLVSSIFQEEVVNAIKSSVSENLLPAWTKTIVDEIL